MAATCSRCEAPMPVGEEMFKYHGYSGPCPRPPKPDQAAVWDDEHGSWIMPAPKTFSFDAAKLAELHKEVDAELQRAAQWPPMNSAHEGYGVLLEEVDELFDHVKTRQKLRDLAAMRKEAIQVAAMALRFAHDICNEERGRR